MIKKKPDRPSMKEILTKWFPRIKREFEDND